MDRPGTSEPAGRDKRRWNPLAALMMKRKLMAIGQRRAGGAGAYALPSTASRAKSGHQVFTWRNNSRQALVSRAIALGVVITGKTPDVIGKPGRGQYRTWKSLASAVERAERQAYVDETVAHVEEGIPKMREALTEAGVLGPAQ